jgi:hypothetical protein
MPHVYQCAKAINTIVDDINLPVHPGRPLQNAVLGYVHSAAATVMCIYVSSQLGPGSPSSFTTFANI